MHLTRFVLPGMLLAAACAIAGCNGDQSMPNDVTKIQDQARLNRPAPGPTEMPPGLGNDLPTPATQPATLPANIQ